MSLEIGIESLEAVFVFSDGSRIRHNITSMTEKEYQLKRIKDTPTSTQFNWDE